jgi:hypothetical protein
MLINLFTLQARMRNGDRAVADHALALMFAAARGIAAWTAISVPGFGV